MMDSYDLYKVRELVGRVIPSQANLRLGEGQPCSVPGCGLPATQQFNQESKSMENGICFDCAMSELKKIAGIPLANKYDDAISEEVEAKDRTSSVIKEILLKVRDSNASGSR